MKNEKSFTLIELLVVIAIIGLLAAVVLVSTGGIQSKAKITKTLEFSQSVQRSLGAYAVGIWSFDDQTNPTKDGSGYGNNGIVNGATFSSDTPHAAIDRGTGKYALNFDGTGGYIITNSVNWTSYSAGTFEYWVKVSSSIAEGDLVGWHPSAGTNNGVATYMAFSNGKVYAVMAGNAGDIWSFSSTDTINNNAWHHVVLTQDGIAAKMYIDGKLQPNTGGGQWFDDAVYSDQAMYVAKEHNTGHYLNGLIDEVRIYEKALTLGEIQKHYAEGLERHKDLVLY